MTAICPHCGFDLVKDEPVEIGDYRYDPRDGFSIAGRRLPLTRSEAELAAALFRERGRSLAYERLLDRLGLTSDRNILFVFRNRIHAKFRAAGLPPPIGAQRGFGLYWQGPPFGAEAGA